MLIHLSGNGLTQRLVGRSKIRAARSGKNVSYVVGIPKAIMVEAGIQDGEDVWIYLENDKVILDRGHIPKLSRDEESFKNILMQRASEKYRYLLRNRGRNTLDFVVGDIRKPFNYSRPEEAGFNIRGWISEDYIENTLLAAILNEGLIERVSSGKYRLTEEGKKYCKRLDPSI
jgi:antitoxin component of MazEF toxin-antitoxin module